MTNKITPMSQRDPRWGGTWMNNDKSTPTHLFGCLNTCLGMMADEYPDSVNYFQMAKKNYTPGTSKIARWDTSWTCGRVVYSSQSAMYPEVSFPNDEIKKLIAWLAHDPAILEVDFYPFDSRSSDFPPQPKEQQHFVLAFGANGNDVDAEILIIDPWDGLRKYLTPRFGQTNARAIIRAIYFEVKS